MTLTSEQIEVFLGAGGDHPRIDISDLGSLDAHPFFELPQGHSAYAVDIDWETGMVAAGTKGGSIYIFGNRRATEDGPVYQTLKQGAPILSVKWIGESVLAASDIAGRCLLWRGEQEGLPRSCEVRGGVVCSLSALDGGLFAGLCSEGKILFWNRSGGRLVEAAPASPTPPVCALVTMVYWPVRQALAFPNLQGDLLLYDLAKQRIEHFHAHEGVFYALSVFDEYLMTAGLEDHRLKIWPPDAAAPIHDLKIQQSAISMGVAAARPAKIIIVDASGAAGIHAIEKGRVSLANRFMAKDYRTVSAFAPERMQALYAQEKSEEVRRLVSGIEDNAGRVSEHVTERRHARLIDLGYAHVSLAIKVKQAENSGDLVGGLGFSKTLMNILPKDRMKACPSMERHAVLLEKAWQIREADTVCRSIRAIDKDYPFTLDAERLARMTESINAHPWIIEPDIPIRHIIQSAMVVDGGFWGRYVLKKLDAEPVRRISLTAEMILEKYEQVWKESGHAGLPVCKVEKVGWISRTELNETLLITMGYENNAEIKGLQYAIQVLASNSDTIVIPMVLFDWCYALKGRAIQKANEKALTALARIENGDDTDTYIFSIHSILKHTLRRLLTEHWPTRRNQ